MADVFEENPCITFGEAAAECGRRWRNMPEEEKTEFRQMAADDKARYTRELAGFRKTGKLPVAKTKATSPRRERQDDGIETRTRGPKLPRTALR